MERSVEILAIILFAVIGLSHLLQPKAWGGFVLLRGRGEAGVFVDGVLNLQLAGIVIACRAWEFQAAGAGLLGVAALPAMASTPNRAMRRYTGSLAVAALALLLSLIYRFALMS